MSHHRRVFTELVSLRTFLLKSPSPTPLPGAAQLHTALALETRAQEARRGGLLPSRRIQADAVQEDPAPRTLHVPSAVNARGFTSDDFLQCVNAHEGPLAFYKENRLSGRYRKDPRQEQAMLLVQTLWEELRGAYRERKREGSSGLTLTEHVGPTEPPRSWWKGLNKLVHGSGDSESEAQQRARGIRGLYLYGGVGTGKTMLMDLLVAAALPSFKLRRLTFDQFMLELHSLLFKNHSVQDPLSLVADEIAGKTRVLALDEFFVEDVGDAVLLSRIFGHLFRRGLVLVATSNRAPSALYERGLQRDLFMPFVAQLKEHTHVFDINSAVDYRKLAFHQSGLFFFPDKGTPDPDAVLEAKFAELAAGCHQPVSRRRISVAMGRHLDVPAACEGLCKFSFEELCGRPVAAADYSALCQNFHTLALQGVPVFTAANRPEAYRMLSLIDVLYEHSIRLLCSAAASPQDLFANVLTVGQNKAPHPQVSEENLLVDDNLGFTKERCISRLTEMETLGYLIKHAKLHSPELLLALQELQAKSKSEGEQRELLEGPVPN